MAYKSLIAKQLTSAFNMSKDLAIDAIFSRPILQEFDFSTGELEPTTIELVTAKVIPSKIMKGKDVETMKILVKTQDITDITVFTEVKINNVDWSIILDIHSNSYTSLLQLSRTL
jgi:hypothetical protein